MADLSSLLQSYSTGGASQNRKAQLAQASEANKQALGGIPTPQDYANAAIIERFGNGGATATPTEQALVNLDPLDAKLAYGLDQGANMVEGVVDAHNNLDRLQDNHRTTGEALLDTGTDVVSGMGNAVAGIGALGLGTVSPTLGAQAAQSIDQINKAVQSSQSDALNDRRTIQAARKALSGRDTQAQRESEGGGLLSGLRKIGRDTMNAVSIAADDPTTLVSGVSQGIGSLLAAGPLAKGATAIGATLTGARMGATAGAGAVPLAIGAMEAGGTYQQTLNKSLAELAGRTDLSESQKIELANKTALDAAAWVAPAAIGAGKLVEGFAGNPLGAVGLRAAAGNMVKEPVEEGIQGGVSQLAQNIALQGNINPNQDLTEGVGEQIGEGALYGLGTAGAMTAPSMVRAPIEAGLSGATKALGGVSRWVDNRNKKVTAGNAAASPLSANKVAEATAGVDLEDPEIVASIEAATAPVETDSPALAEAKAKAAEAFPLFMGMMKISPEETTHPAVSILSEDIADAPDRVQAVLRSIESINAETDMDTKVEKVIAMQALMAPFEAAQAHITGIDQQFMPTDVAEFFDSFGSISIALQESSEVTELMQATADYFSDETGQAALNNLNQTVESAARVALAAQVAPEKINPEVAGVVLKMATDGRISLTPSQQAALTLARDVMAAAREYDAAALEAGGRPIDVVGAEVKTSETNGQDRLSALQHGRVITGLFKQGKMKEAKSALEDFGVFMQGQFNKVMAMNDSLAEGGGKDKARKVPVRVGPNRMRESRISFGVTPTDAGSVRFAQMAAAEGRFLANVFNGMAQAYPQLGVQPVTAPELDTRLKGKPTEVAAAFKSGSRTTATAQPQQAVAATEPVAINPEVADFISKVETFKVEPVAKKKATPTKAETVTDTAPAKQEAESTAPVTEEAKNEETPEPVQPAAEAPTTVEADVQPEVADTQDGTTDESTAPDAPVTEALDESPEPVVPTVADAFPNLLNQGEGTNYFGNVFKLSKTRPALLRGVGSPIEAIRNAFKSTKAFTDLTGKEFVKRDVDSNIAGFYSDDAMTIAENISAKVYEQLEAALDGSNGKKAIAPNLDAGDDGAAFIRAKALAIVNKNPDGSYTYNQELIESAVLAGVNWMFNAKDTTNIKEASDVGAILGIPEGQVTDAMIALFQGGSMTLLDVVPAMAQQITQFWGVQANKDFDQSATVGIPQAVASEILEAMIDLQYMKVTKARIPGVVNTPDVFSVNTDRLNDTYLEYPNLLADMLEVDVPEAVYLNGDVPPVDRLQMNSKDVELTPAQLEMVRNESATPYKLVPYMHDLYQAMGLDNILDIFGAGELSEETHNKNHLESAEGKNQAIRSAFQSYMARVEHMKAVADKANIPVTELEVRYPFGVSSVGRAQMLGAYNPQASKLVREMIMPNRATVDLTDPKMKQMHNLALAQMMDVKIHTISFEETNKQLAKKIAKVQPAIALLVKQLETGQLDADAQSVIKDAVGQVGGTFMALHAIMELARLEVAPDLTNHETSIYVEADGVTNGPANAVMNMTPGNFTEDWVMNAARGGLNLQGETMNQFRDGDDNDMYKASTVAAAKHRESLMARLKEADLDGYGNDMAKLLAMFSKDITVEEDDKGKVSVLMTRGAAKNPLTITVYGSGTAGIAGKAAKTLVDAIYAEMSAALKRQQANPKLSVAEAMFGHKSVDKVDAENKLRELARLLNRFTQESVYYNTNLDAYQKGQAKKTVYNTDGDVLEEGKVPVPRFDPRTLLDLKNFTLHPDHFTVLQGNIKTLHTDYMRKGIEEVLGDGLMDTVDTVQKLTNFQSMAMALEFETAVNAKLDELYPEKDSKGNRTVKRFLSDNQQRAIIKDLAKKYPLVKNAEQQFLVVKTSRSIQKTSDFSKTFSERFSMDAAVFAPTAAGVKGVPSLNIGMGDGLMMQLMSNMEGAVQGTLKIFDGVNLPLDKIEEGSLQANKAVHQTWQGNIVGDVMRSYEAAHDSVLEQLLADIGKGVKSHFNQTYKQMRIKSPAELQGLIELFRASGNKYANEIQARHNALQRVNVTVDQMASAAQPFRQEGGIDLSQLSEEDAADELNRLYKEELAKLNTRKESVAEIKGLLTDDARPAVIYTAESLLLESRKFPADLYETVKAALRNPAMRDYVLYTGTKAQMEAKYGHPIDANGITDTANKRIYIVSAEPEVIAHELIHAATYENVAAVVDGSSRDGLLIDSVNRLRELRSQFEEFVQSGALLEVTPEQMMAIRNVVNSMTQADALYGEAAALNEFMAWSTTNADLIAVGKTQTAKPSALVNFSRRAVALLRRIFFGSAPDRLPRDFFNHVRFNTALVAGARVKPLAQRMEAAVLKHTAKYGNSERLAEVQRAYVSTLAPVLAKASGKVARLRSAQLAASLTTKVAAVFPMSGQAASTFRTIVGVLGTEAVVNPASMAKAQDLYNQVAKVLKTEDFMRNPTGNDPADELQARQKFDLIMGKSTMVYDDRGRSSLMPAFLALATVDDGFREVLSKIELPRVDKYEGNTLDERLRNAGARVMEMMTDRMAGVTSSNVLDAVDALQEHVAAVVQEKETALSKISEAVAGTMDKGNDALLRGIEALANKGVGAANKLRASGWNRAAEFTELASNLVVSDRAEAVSESGISLMNNIKGVEALRSLANDIIGRVGSNASIYDMIKKVRSHIAAVRQEFRENVPKRLEAEFTTKPTDLQWSAMTNVMAKTDLASQNMSWSTIEKLLADDKAMDAAIAKAEDKIKAVAGNHAGTYFRKLEQLATYMNTGVPGSMLLRNAESVARLYGERDTGVAVTPAFIRDLDALGSLYAARKVSPQDKASVLELKGDKGLPFLHAYLKQQATDERKRAAAGEGSKWNYYKGYVPTLFLGGESLVITHDAAFASMALKSYERLGDYKGAGAEGPLKRGYYFSNTPANAAFQQGIVQNVTHTGGGVSAEWGYTQGISGGVIDNRAEVLNLEGAILSGYENGKGENLMPVFDKDGALVAFERSVDPEMLAKLSKDNRAHMLAGAWRGRQVEESLGSAVNSALVQNLADMYKNDTPARKASEYVNLFDLKDKVSRDAFKLVPASVREQMQMKSGREGVFMVRRDVLQDVLGYRSATIGDAWTGNSRWSKDTLDGFRKVAVAVAGNDAYRYLVNAEKTLINFMGDARTLIAIKSVVVPVGNILSNMAQLVSMGVPLKAATAGGLKYVDELETYVKNRLRQVDAEAELRAAKSTLEKQKLSAEVQSLKDTQKRLSIWPLLEAGEFTAISDVGLNHEDTKLSKGKWLDFVESQVSKLPEGVRTAGRYAVISQDTALFQGLQKMVQYGDFIAKATLYHDLVGRKGLSHEEALGQVTEAFVNYDRLPGRDRGAMEQIGLMWFYNFKLRIMKVAAKMLRDNPLHTLTVGMLPIPDVLGVGSPVTDNALAKAVEGTLGYSIGPGMGLSAPSLNPWYNLAN